MELSTDFKRCGFRNHHTPQTSVSQTKLAATRINLIVPAVLTELSIQSESIQSELCLFAHSSFFYHQSPFHVSSSDSPTQEPRQKKLLEKWSIKFASAWAAIETIKEKLEKSSAMQSFASDSEKVCRTFLSLACFE